MADHPNVLTLVPGVRRRQWEDGSFIRNPESQFLDIQIDDIPLRQRIPSASDLVTDLNRPWLDHVGEAVQVLLGRHTHPQLGIGRAPILVCGVCGDLDCGAVTAAVIVDPDTVTWTDWRWADADGEEVIEPALPDFVFATPAYTAALAGAAARVANMPYDELEHRGKSFLWPWQWGWKMPKA